MNIVEISTQQHIREFLNFPRRLYQNENNWICPLDADIEAVFDKKKNKRFLNGEATRWLLTDSSGKTIGRVATFIDKTIALIEKQATGGMGFFECIDKQEAADMLFETCRKWLAERGIQAMDGPVNFGDRDRFWGLLVEGFDPPNYGMFYHFPYYQRLFENYGFKDYYKQLTFRRNPRGEMQAAIAARAERIRKNPEYTFETIKKNNLGKYVEDFRTIYNKAWVKHLGVSEMTPEQATQLAKDLKSIMDEKIILFVYYKAEPVAFFVCLPELNQIFRFVNGKLNLRGILLFLWHKWRKTCRKMFGVAFGVVPEHQGRGIEGAMIMNISEMLRGKDGQYDDFEMNWIGDFNTTMIKVARLIGSEISKTHITYRKLFDENQLFERHPITN